MSVDKILALKYGPWWNSEELVDAASKQHDSNLEACKKALDSYNQKDRPLQILVIHGSSRSSMDSAAAERSNSQMLLEYGLKQVAASDCEVTRVALHDYAIEPCEGCLSTASALCGFPCNCFPFDPMQKLYPMVLRADLILMSTPVNQAAMSTRLKTFADRLISLDGGFLVDQGQYEPKDPAHRAKMVQVSRDGNIEYAQRLFGRVAAYFISSKDQENPSDQGHTPYGEMVAESLRVGFETYGMFHADPSYVVAVSKWDEDYCYDKQRLNDNQAALEQATIVVEKALALARAHCAQLPKPKMDRMNRT